jgi:ferrous iron transport protein A
MDPLYRQVQIRVTVRKGGTVGRTDPISLAELPIHGRAIIESLGVGRLEVNRLAALGFTPGAEVDVLQNNGRGPLIVTVRGTQVALGRGEAAKILVVRGPVE